MLPNVTFNSLLCIYKGKKAYLKWEARRSLIDLWASFFSGKEGKIWSLKNIKDGKSNFT